MTTTATCEEQWQPLHGVVFCAAHTEEFAPTEQCPFRLIPEGGRGTSSGRVLTWGTEDDWIVWGTHSPGMASAAWTRDGWDKTGSGKPDFTRAWKLWADPKVLELEVWPADAVTTEASGDHVPFLQIEMG